MSKEIYVVMCRNHVEPEIAFTNRINALNYAEEFNSIGFYKVKVVEVELKQDIKEPPVREPLSDDEIDLGYQSSPRNYYDLAFRDGVRFAEKYHKIGIDNV